MKLYCRGKRKHRRPDLPGTDDSILEIERMDQNLSGGAKTRNGGVAAVTPNGKIAASFLPSIDTKRVTVDQVDLHPV